MNNLNILITGGTGFIGTELISSLNSEQNTFYILTRAANVFNKKKLTKNIFYINSLNKIDNTAKIDVIINLAGAPIDKRWTKSYKKILFSSRIDTTKNIINLIKRLNDKPKVLINASAIGYYGSQDKTLDEKSDYKDCFTHQLCAQWEDIARTAENYGVRVCIARLGVVLGKNGGMLKKISLPFKLGLGGKLGSGEQYFSWIHIDDVINIFKLFINDNSFNGAYNLTSPNPVTNYEFTKSIGKLMHRPTFICMPEIIIKILFSEMGEELLLGNYKVLPNRLLELKYNFLYPKINSIV